MKKFYLPFIFLFAWATFVPAQVVINELDCDTPSIDDKEFVELLSETPFYPLDGYVLVFFNGSASGGNKSYLTLDLDGYTTDINGLFLIGSNNVIPTPHYLIPISVIQNGADAVALYKGSEDDFPEHTLAYVDDNLIDVLIYGTNDPDAGGLLNIFRAFNPHIEQINEGAANNTNSIQRFVDNEGHISYLSTMPTPRKMNDGSGIILNGISINVDQSIYKEGENFLVEITTEYPVAEDLNLVLSLDNYGFNSDDYEAVGTLTIPKREQTVSTTINLLIDGEQEGDEIMIIRVSGYPETFMTLNNNVQIRVVDIDFTVANFGSPLQPTYGLVDNQKPDGYYDRLDGLAGEDLRLQLQQIIADPEIVRAQTYTDVIDILKQADQNPENSNEVWLVYQEFGRPKLDYQYGSENEGKWNREHTFPRSRGGFYSINLDEEKDGKDIFWTTNADSLRHANSDVHAIRVADSKENSRRNNLHYGQYNGPKTTAGSFKGDVARGVFYLAVRYHNLEIVEGYPDKQKGVLGDLQTLLEWHRQDPPDDFEMNRNNIIYSWQYNRNPFIDHPELIEFIWGDRKGEKWNQALSVPELSFNNIKVHPNPVIGDIVVTGKCKDCIMEMFHVDGRKIMRTIMDSGSIHKITYPSKIKSGMYLIKFTSPEINITQKVIIK